MKKSNKRKSWILAGALALALVTILAATFAWFSASDSVTNKLATKDGLANVSIQETFIPPDDWKPGQTVTKEVAIANTGTAPALARISFAELLKVTQAPAGEATAFDATMAAAGKSPVSFDNTAYSTTNGWYPVTTTPNASINNLSLAADYSPAVVYAKYVSTGSTPSYSFVVWAPVAGSTTGQLQAVDYTTSWDQATNKVSLSNLSYLTYQGTISTTASWTATPPAAADIYQSLAEDILNSSAGNVGNYPNNIKLNYANISATPTPNMWYYNPADGYFYYCGVVAPGTITPNLLSSLLLDPAADSTYYANMEFDLTVNSQALQATKDALAAEWPTVAADSALNTLLQGVCE